MSRDALFFCKTGSFLQAQSHKLGLIRRVYYVSVHKRVFVVGISILEMNVILNRSKFFCLAYFLIFFSKPVELGEMFFFSMDFRTQCENVVTSSRLVSNIISSTRMQKTRYYISQDMNLFSLDRWFQSSRICQENQSSFFISNQFFVSNCLVAVYLSLSSFHFVLDKI